MMMMIMIMIMIFDWGIHSCLYVVPGMNSSHLKPAICWLMLNPTMMMIIIIYDADMLQHCHHDHHLHCLLFFFWEKKTFHVWAPEGVRVRCPTFLTPCTKTPIFNYWIGPKISNLISPSSRIPVLFSFRGTQELIPNCWTWGN